MRRSDRQPYTRKALTASLAMILCVVVGTLGSVAYLNSNNAIAPPASSSLEAASADDLTSGLATSTPRPLPALMETATPRPADLPTSVAGAPEYALVMPEPKPTRRPVTTPATRQSEVGAASRAGCDPAYPEARTCIPPGPPFDQGCAITDERLFEVRPPDPQGLDHDGDGIGCEPIGART